MFKAVIKSNIKRYWWVFALNLAALTLTFIVPVLSHSSVDYYGRDHYNFSIGSLAMLEILFGAVNGWCLFAYINSSRAVNLFHSLPSTRTSIFLANILCGGISVILPNLGLAAVLPMLADGHYKEISASTCFGYIFTNGAIIGLLAFALACFTVMFSGSAVAGKVFTPIIAMLPAFLWAILDVTHSELLYGSKGFFIDLPFDLDNMPYDDKLGITATFWAALIVIAVLLAGAYIAFRRRQMESAGEVVTVKWAKVLFIQGSALCFGDLLTGLVFQKWTLFLPLIGFGLIAAAAAMMILQKTYRIKGYLKQAIAYVCIISVIYAVFAFDLTGYERRVPDPSKVKSVTLNFSYYNTFASIKDFSDPDFIKTVTEAHRQIVKDKPEGGAYTTFPISYELKGGGHMERLYKLPDDELEKYLGSVMMNDLYKNHAYSLDEEWSNVTFYKDGRQYYISRDNIPALKAALEQDVAEGDFDSLYLSDGDIYVDLDITVPYTDTGEAVQSTPPATREYEYPPGTQLAHVSVGPRLSNTWACLMELTAHAIEPDADDIPLKDEFKDEYYSTIPDVDAVKAELEDKGWGDIFVTEGWGYPMLAALSRNLTEEEKTSALYGINLNLTPSEKKMSVCTVRGTNSTSSASAGETYIFVTVALPDGKDGEVYIYRVEYWSGEQKLSPETASPNEILDAGDASLTPSAE